MIFSSCTPIFYQVYDVEYRNLEKKENRLVYTNNDIDVSYNLWGESGNGFFIIKNNTDKNIFVILPESFMIKNGNALDYFNDSETSETISNYLSIYTNEARSMNLSIYGKYWNYYSDWYDASLSKRKRTIGRSDTYTVKERPIICIPPKSFKLFGKYSIYDNIVQSNEREQAYPKLRSQKVHFEKSDTPMHIINRIAYSFNPDGKMNQYVDHEFWISDITNYSEKAIVKKTIKLKTDKNNTNVERVFKIGSPNSFYNIY